MAEATGYADLSAWPAGSRLILRKERPHPGAQLRITDADRHRVTGFLTNSAGEDLVALELRHRRHVGLRVRDVECLRRRLSVHENAVQLGVDHAVAPTGGARPARYPCLHSS